MSSDASAVSSVASASAAVSSAAASVDADVSALLPQPVTIAAVMAPTNISATNFFIIDPPVDRFVCYHSTMVKQPNMNEL